VLELQPNSAEARYNLGMTYLSEKRYDDAKAAFAQLGTQDSRSPYAHYGVGLVLAEQRNDAAAIDELKKALDSGAKIPGAYFEMGNSYARLKKYEEAIAAYSKEKEISGDNPDVENALAEAYAANGMKQQAEAARARAGQLRSGHPGP